MGNDAASVTAYFTQQVGRPPTAAELAAYTDPSLASNWQQALQDNIAAPNGYANFLQYGSTTVPGPGAGGPVSTQPIAPVQSSVGVQAAGTAPAPLPLPDRSAFGVASPYVAPQYSGSFTAPTLADAEATPGYQFQQQQGNLAITNAAAGNGSLNNPGTIQSEIGFNQGLAQTDYQNVYNNQFQNYQQNYNQFLNNAQLGQSAYQTNLGAYDAAAGLTQQQSALNLNQFGAQTAANNQTFTQGQTAANNQFGQIAASSANNFGQDETLNSDYWNRLLALSGQGASAVATGASA